MDVAPPFAGMTRIRSTVCSAGVRHPGLRVYPGANGDRDASWRSCSKARKSPTPAPSAHGRLASRRSRTNSTRASARARLRRALRAPGGRVAGGGARRARDRHDGTASGKTLAFDLPVLDALAREPKPRAIYLYPTKALAQDQLRTLAELAVPGVTPAIYDGDTPGDRRWQIREWANLILTNPDMLHVGRAPASRPAGRRPSEPALRRRRRAAHLPGRVRLARRRRPAPARRAAAMYARRATVPPRLRRRSRTQASSRNGCSAWRRRWSVTTPRRARNARSCSGTPSCSTRSRRARFGARRRVARAR